MMRLPFVADGRERLLRSSWYWKKRAAIKAKVRAKYADELAKATGYWDKLKIRSRIAEEIRREMKEIASPYALWISQ